MARIEESIEISAPPRKIWPIVRWDRVPEWMGIVKKVEYTSDETERTGATAHWIGEAGGIKSEWDTETVEWEPFVRGAWRTTSGTLTGMGSMTLTPTDSGTKTTFMMDYELPYSILGKIVDKLRVCRAVEKGARDGLRRLKEMTEGS